MKEVLNIYCDRKRVKESEGVPMREVIDGHDCEMTINDDGSFTFKFDGEETWHTRTGAEKSCTRLGILTSVFTAYFKDTIDTFNFNKKVKEVMHDI